MVRLQRVTQPSTPGTGASASSPRRVKPRGLCVCRVPGVVWAMWVAGRWPTPASRSHHGERHPSIAAVRRRDRRARSPRTAPGCRSPLHPPRGSAGRCVRFGRGGLTVRTIGRLLALPRCAGAVAAAGRRPPSGGRLAPSRVKSNVLQSLRGAFGAGWCCFAAPCCPEHRGIWLILPVVICLSQRLSHACLSISNLYCETANGSLNQLSFI